MTLKENLAALESSVSQLKAERGIGPLQNDIYEAMDDLGHLGQRAVAGDTRVNYRVRSESDLMLFQKLRECVSAAGAEERYRPLLDRAETLLGQIAEIPIPPDGHLGVLAVLRSRFDFLFDQYGFTVADEQPTGMRITRGAVVLEIGWATQSSLSFSMRRGDLGDFWLEDLLYLCGDQRYKSVPQAIHLSTERDVDAWFQFVSDALRHHGNELLSDSPGAFVRLAQAQAQRDAEYVARMNANAGRFGSGLPQP
ncbi:hypothetical protein [Occallatibacter riparius]|uniref:Uncharacterized protein n=1 Tax=Occallatibacter riparius TaxID=1002689 RepID=A0A9J7BHG8_9BACT|nr:hypothetical protein [Occallatibacter riparius]UWZ82167.1 hypothetical protein MOP44_16475 [Occallatibacter riparius]